MYYFVRDNIQYVSDPYAKEYIASPLETLKTGGGDCDDGALLLAAMLESIGVNTRIVTIPGHAFVKAEMPDAPPKYKIGGWIYMDWTCRTCSFGEIPYNNILQLSD
jgi:transglutaminase-like putative cysteine protease